MSHPTKVALFPLKTYLSRNHVCMKAMTINQISEKYPNEWVLLGNPEMQNTKVLGGIVLYHSKDKKEVCYLGKSKTEGFEKITLAYTGVPERGRRVGIMKRI